MDQPRRDGGDVGARVDGRKRVYLAATDEIGLERRAVELKVGIAAVGQDATRAVGEGAGNAIAGPGERAGYTYGDLLAEIGVANDRHAALDSTDQVEGIVFGSGVVVGHDSKAEAEGAVVEDVDWCGVGERITVNVDGRGVLDNHILTGYEDDTGWDTGREANGADAVEIERDVAVGPGLPGRVGTDDDVTTGAVETDAGIDIVGERAVGVGVDVKAETRCRITDGDFDGIGQAAEDDDIVDGADVDETGVGSTDRREDGAGAGTVGTVDGDVAVGAGSDRGQAHVLAGSHIILDQHGAGVRGQVDVAAGLNLEAVIRIQGNRISLDNDIGAVVGVGRLGLDPGGV